MSRSEAKGLCFGVCPRRQMVRQTDGQTVRQIALLLRSTTRNKGHICTTGVVQSISNRNKPFTGKSVCVSERKHVYNDTNMKRSSDSVVSEHK